MTRPSPTPALNAIINSYKDVGAFCNSTFVKAPVTFTFRRSYDDSVGPKGPSRVTIYDFTIEGFGFGDLRVRRYNNFCDVDLDFDNITLGENVRYAAYYESRHGGFGLMTFLKPILLAKLENNITEIM